MRFLYNNKTKNILAGILLISFFVLPAVLKAQTTDGSEPQSLGNNLQQLGNAAKYNTENNNITYFPVIVGLILSYFFSLLGLIFLGLIVYAGIIWMTAHGREENVQKAKDIIRNSVIGIIILLGSYAIVYFVIAALSDANINRNLEGFR